MRRGKPNPHRSRGLTATRSLCYECASFTCREIIKPYQTLCQVATRSFFMQFSFVSRLFNWWIDAVIRFGRIWLGSESALKHRNVKASAEFPLYPPVKQFTKNCVTVVCSRGRLFNWMGGVQKAMHCLVAQITERRVAGGHGCKARPRPWTSNPITYPVKQFTKAVDDSRSDPPDPA